MFNTLGSLGQSNLISQPNVPSLNLISLLEKDLQYIAHQHIEQLSRKIYPVEMSVTNAYHGLYRTLINYFLIQTGKGNSYQIITSDVTRFASSISEALSLKLNEIFKRQDVRKKIFQLIKRTPNNQTQTNSHMSHASKSFGRGAHSTTLLESIGTKYGEDGQTKYGNLLNKQLNQTFRKENVTQVDPSISVAEKYMREKISIENLKPRIQFQREMTSIGQLTKKKCLICDIFITTNESSSKKGMFECKDCHQMYHKKCMPRDNNCCVCQLTYINPLQKSKNILFVGFLKKATKKHEIEFEFKKEHEEYGLEQKEKNGKKSTIPSIELRCIRLKDKNDAVANFINLFPDACTVMVNNRLIKQFQPLHKQSSLKYRRDECIKISSNLNIGMNRITITERILKKQIKTDERIEPQNHLVIVCIAESLQVPKPANKLEQFLTKSGYMANPQNTVEKFLLSMDSKVTQFSQSQNLLKKSMFISSRQDEEEQQEEIACDNLKVPLVCSLTLQKMKYPGRSIFCKHFACFDVYNFVLLNAQAKLPKWQCPICKASAYKFQIDCVMKSIVNQLQKIADSRKSKEEEEPIQVQFDANFGVKFINCQGKTLVNKKSKMERKEKAEQQASEAIPHWLSNIYELPIEGKNKRERQRREESEPLKKTQLLLDAVIPEEDSQFSKQKNQIKPQQNVGITNNSCLESQSALSKPEPMEQQNPQPQQQSIQFEEVRLQNIIQEQPKQKPEFCNFKVVIKPLQIDEKALILTSNNVSQPEKKNDPEGQQSKLLQKDKEDNKDEIPHQGNKEDEQKNLMEDCCKQNNVEERQLFPKDNQGQSPISEKLSSQDLEMQKALKQYEQQRKLKNAIKPAERQNQVQDNSDLKEQAELFEENQRINAFYASYHSYPSDPVPNIQLTQSLTQKAVINEPVSTNSKENEIPVERQAQQKEKPEVKNTNIGEEFQNEMQDKSYQHKIKKTDINLFKGYSTRNNNDNGKKKQPKSSESSKKSCTTASRSRNGKQKEKDRKMRERQKGKEFELPEDADIIQLSD